MTKRKVIGDSKSGRLVYESERFTRAEVERVIKACAEAAVEMSANSVGPFTCEYLRSAVIAAGRRAAKEET